MLQVAPKILLMFVMLWHSLLGCCIHHVHGSCAEGQMDLSLRDSSTNSCQSCCRHASPSPSPKTAEPESEPISHEQEQELCDETHCVYMHDEQRLAASDLLMFWTLFCIDPTVAAVITGPDQTPDELLSQPRSPREMAVRCALFQVWLL